VEAEANSEATNFIRSRKRNQKILRLKKRKQTRKHDTSRGAESGSKKYSIASISLFSIHLILNNHNDTNHGILIRDLDVCTQLMWTSALLVQKNLEFFKIYGVSARTRGLIFLDFVRTFFIDVCLRFFMYKNN